MIPRLFGIGIGQINLLIDTKFATAARMPAGSLAALYVADRVMELVLGGYAIAVATAILPMMSHQAAAKDYASLAQRCAKFDEELLADIRKAGGEEYARICADYDLLMREVLREQEQHREGGVEPGLDDPDTQTGSNA